MKTIMRPRYYCEHCGKGSGSPSYMRRHELGCTLNPARVCGMCKEPHQKSPAELTRILNAHGFAAMQEAANHCPACILSGLRPLNTVDDELGPIVLGPQDGRQEWSYKEAKAEWWRCVNEASMERECL